MRDMRDFSSLFEPDITLPGPSVPIAAAAERRLWAAVMENAIAIARGETWAYEHHPLPTHRERGREEAIAWIRTVDHLVGGFDFVCGLLGWDPGWIRAGLARTAGFDTTPCQRAIANESMLPRWMPAPVTAEAPPLPEPKEDLSMAETRTLIEAELERIGPRDFSALDVAAKLPKLTRPAVVNMIRRLAAEGRIVITQPGGAGGKATMYARRLAGDRSDAPLNGAEYAAAAPTPSQRAPRAARKPSASVPPPGDRLGPAVPFLRLRVQRDAAGRPGRRRARLRRPDARRPANPARRDRREIRVDLVVLSVPQVLRPCAVTGRGGAAGRGRCRGGRDHARGGD